MFEVLQEGVYTTIQDLGRQQMAHKGIKSLGAMDEYAYRLSQKLLENHDGNALEILLGGLSLKALQEATISICGADLEFRLDGEKKPIWQTYHLQAGDIIAFTKRKHGMRTYLAVKGGFTTQKTDGSFSTVHKLQKGEILPFSSSRQIGIRRIPKKYIPTYHDTLTLRLLPTSQEDYFSDAQKEKFFNTSYTITPQMNRMGYKLEGKTITPSKSGIISEGIAFGAVQIPKDGQPIILLRDRQTIGGYPKIGTVLAKDCFKLSQLPIGAKVRFEKITPDICEQEMRTFYHDIAW